MKFDITNFQTLAANLPVEGEVCDLAHAEVSTQTETDTEIAPLIQQVAATSIAEIDQLMAELQEGKTICNRRGSELSKRRFVMRTLHRWLRPRSGSSLTPSPNGTPPATNKIQALPTSRRLRPRTTSVRSGKVTTTVSETCPTSITPLSVFSLDPGYGIDKLRNERYKTLQSGRNHLSID
jgi:hypothetical protein